MKKIIILLVLLVFIFGCSPGEAYRTKILPAYDENKCIDSDNGINLLEKGTTQGKYYWSFASKSDYCSRAGLVEFYCSRNKVQKTIKDCGELGSEFVCNEGKCVYKDISSLAEAITVGANSDYEKVVKLVDWEMKNFFHAGGLWGWDTYEGYTNILSLPIKELFKERIVGCHQAANILVSLLNSLNIPAEKIVIENHGVVYLSSLDKYVHGDYIANLVSVPAEQLIMTEEELNGYAYSQEGYKAFQKLVKYDEALGEWVNIVHLKRKENSLYIEGYLAKDYYEQDYLNYLENKLSKYNIVFEEEGDKLVIKSDFVPIIEILSAPEIPIENIAFCAPDSLSNPCEYCLDNPSICGDSSSCVKGTLEEVCPSD